MKGLFGRLIAYLFLGSFCVAGPVLLIVALSAAAQRGALIYFGMHTEGTVIAKRTTGSSRPTYAPVVQFTAIDGRTYTFVSNVYGREAAFQYGERVPVLYRQNHPELARIDAFAQLWTLPLVSGVVGAAFSIIPALMIVAWRRRRDAGADAAGAGKPACTATASPALRSTIGVLLTFGGVALLALGIIDSSSLNGSRAVGTALGVFVATCGLLIGQWAPVGGRIHHALGGLAITSLAVIFGWVAIYGDAAGFSGGISMGGVAVTSSGAATPARIAFGLASIVFGLSSLWAWKRVFRARG